MAAKHEVNPNPQTFYAFEKISATLAKDLISWIVSNNSATETKHPFLTLIVNSDGGELASAFAIIDAMRGSRIPIKTAGTGEIASAGLLITMAGEKGERLITPNTSIMSHRFSAGSDGKYHELMAMTKEYELIQTKMIQLYVTHTGLTVEEVEAHLLPHSDMYLSVDEALLFGLCDKVGYISF